MHACVAGMRHALHVVVLHEVALCEQIVPETEPQRQRRPALRATAARGNLNRQTRPV